MKLQEYLKLLLIPEIFRVCFYFSLVMMIRLMIIKKEVLEIYLSISSNGSISF